MYLNVFEHNSSENKPEILTAEFSENTFLILKYLDLGNRNSDYSF